MARRQEIACDLKVSDALGHVILWVLLTIVTIGIAGFLFPYAFAKFIINKSYVMEDGKRVRKFQCDLDVSSQIGHAILWYLLSIVTLGVAFCVYVYKVQAYALNKTTLVEY